MSAYSQAIAATSTQVAPWVIVPANSKLQRNLIVSKVICDALEGLNLTYPKPLPGIEKIKIE
jgi:polyphosphate kinase 2 (PPK2 family)